MYNAVKGKKTYIISALAALVGVLQLLDGHQYTQVLPYLFAGAFGASLRAAVAKIEAKVLGLLPNPVEDLVKPVIDAEIQKVEG